MKTENKRTFIKVLAFALISIATPLFSHINAQQAAAPKWVSKAQKSIVSVVTYDKEGNMLHSGTGFYIASNGIAMADYGLFKGAYSAVVVDMNGEKSNVERILGADDTYALVRFKTANKKATPLSIAASTPSRDAMVFAVNFSKDKISQCPSATVADIKLVNEDIPYYSLSYATGAEYLGAPLFNSNGDLIGTIQPSLNASGYAIGIKFADKLIIQALSTKANNLALEKIHIKKGLPDTAEESLVYLYVKSRNTPNEEYVDMLNLFIETYPDNAEGYYRRATPYTDMCRFDDADNDLQTYLKLSEDKALANSKIADAIHTKLVYQPTPEYDKWNFDVALDYINKALAEKPDNFEFKLLKTQILMSKKDYDSAIEIYDEINNSDLRSPATLYASSLAHGGRGDSVNVQIELLDSAISLFGNPLPAEAANYILQRGRLFANSERYREAVQDYNQYCYLCNNKVSDVFYYDRAQLESNGKMYQQALEDLNTAISMSPRTPLYYIEKGGLLLRVNQIDESITTLQQALQLAPNAVDAYRMLGYAQIQKGDKVNGKKNLEKAVELGDENAQSLIDKYAK